MRQAGADQGDRQGPARALVQRHYERLELGRLQKLDLVEQEDDAHAIVLCRLADGDEQVAEVFGQGAAVADPGERLHVQACRHGAVAAEADGERLEDGGGSEHAVGPASLGGDLQQRAPHLRRHLGAEGGVLLHLPLHCGPVAGLGLLAEHVEQHRFAHAAQPGDDHRLLGVAVLQTLEQDVERLDLLVTTDQGRRLGAGARRIGVLAWVHRAPFSG